MLLGGSRPGGSRLVSSAGKAVVGFGMCALMLTACGNSGPSTSGTRTGTLSIAADALPPAEGNPFQSGYAGQGVWLLPAIFNTLTSGTDSGIKPELATSWSNPAPDTWIFKIRRGVKFSDGEALNASTAAFTFNYLASPAGKQTVDGSNTPTLQSATATGPYTLQITTSAPTLDLPGLLDQDDIVAPNAWRKLGPKGFGLHPVGTGPYEVTSWGPDEVRLKAVPGAWQPGKVKNLDFIEVPNEAAGFSALQAGEVQVLYGPSLSEVQEAKKNASLQVLDIVTPNVFTWQFLTSPGSPIMNQQVRVAMNEAVDRRAIDQLLDKTATAANQGVGPGVPGHDSSLGPIVYDPAGARRLLTQAGFAKGFSITLAETSTGTLGSAEVFSLVKSELASIGINVSFEALPFPQWLQDFLAGKFPGAQMTNVLYASTPQMDGELPLARGSCVEEPTPLWCTQPQGQLLKAASAATTEQTRTAILTRVAQSERANPPAIWLYRLPDIAIASKSVNAKMTIIDSLDFATLSRK